MVFWWDFGEFPALVLGVVAWATQRCPEPVRVIVLEGLLLRKCNILTLSEAGMAIWRRFTLVMFSQPAFPIIAAPIIAAGCEETDGG